MKVGCPIPRLEAELPEYRKWRKAVQYRCKYACCMPGCLGGGGQLEAHHIEMWAVHPELRYDPLNGILLCNRCHTKVTGDEAAYIQIFKEIVSKQVMAKQTKTYVTRKTNEFKKRPWKPTNPNMRYGN